MKNILLVFALFFISILINFTIAPLIIISMAFTDYYLLTWYNTLLIACSGFIKYFYDVQVYVDNIDNMNSMMDGNNIVISNHLSEFDFLYTFALLKNNNIHLKFIIYYHLYLFPGIGIILYLLDCIQITDNKKQSLANIEKCKINKNTVLFLYPEGTIYNNISLAKSNDYCIKNNIERTKTCLYPRTKALNIIAKNNNIDTLYSIHTKYNTDNIYNGLTKVDIPNRVYMKINKIKTNNIEEDTIKIFRDMDKITTKDEYIQLDITLSEKIYMVVYLSLFAILCIHFYEIRYYLYTTIILYYSYLVYNI